MSANAVGDSSISTETLQKLKLGNGGCKKCENLVVERSRRSRLWQAELTMRQSSFFFKNRPLTVEPGNHYPISILNCKNYQNFVAVTWRYWSPQQRELVSVGSICHLHDLRLKLSKFHSPSLCEPIFPSEHDRARKWRAVFVTLPKSWVSVTETPSFPMFWRQCKSLEEHMESRHTW